MVEIPVWLIPVSGLSIIIVNVLIWVFVFGKFIGKLGSRINNLEEKLGNPMVLPECHKLFAELREGISNLVGKMEVVLSQLKVNSKNNEKEYLKGKK